MELLAVGGYILLWLVIFVLILFFLPLCNLERWDFLCSCACGLCSSLDKLLSELTQYANLLYAESVSSPIVAWR
jgi:hypothetical protein